MQNISIKKLISDPVSSAEVTKGYFGLWEGVQGIIGILHACKGAGEERNSDLGLLMYEPHAWY